MSDPITVSVDLTECQYRSARCKKEHGICRVCLNEKHCAAHAPPLGQPITSMPYDHYYEPKERTT